MTSAHYIHACSPLVSQCTYAAIIMYAFISCGVTIGERKPGLEWHLRMALLRTVIENRFKFFLGKGYIPRYVHTFM